MLTINQYETMKIGTSKVCTVVCMSALTLATALGARADQTEAPAKPDKSYTGMASTVDPQEHTLSLKGVFLHKKFNLGDNCAYVLPDQSTGTFSDLRPGERVRVSYQDSHGVLVADRVEQLPMRYEGMVKAIDPAAHTMTVHVRTLDKDFQIANDCRITLREDKAGSLADIQTGDHVTVTYEAPDNQLTARQIAQTSILFTGSLVAIDLPERTVKAREGFTTKKFNLADHCAIVMNGKTDGRLDDLKPNDHLVFSYEEVNGINVVNRIGTAPANPNSMVTTYSGVPPY
jgi:Cu/Ag efflux protein CusF